MCKEELARRLPHYNEFDGASLAVQMLLRTGRIEEEVRDGRVVYVPVTRHHNLYSDDWEMRIDALAEHSAAIAETLRLRFLESTPDPRATARTFTFKAREDEIEEFQEELLTFIRGKYRELEKRALELEEQSSAERSVNRSSCQSECKESNVSSFSLYLGMTPTPHSTSASDQ